MCSVYALTEDDKYELDINKHFFAYMPKKNDLFNPKEYGACFSELVSELKALKEAYTSYSNAGEVLEKAKYMRKV